MRNIVDIKTVSKLTYFSTSGGGDVKHAFWKHFKIYGIFWGALEMYVLPLIFPTSENTLET